MNPVGEWNNDASGQIYVSGEGPCAYTQKTKKNIKRVEFLISGG